MEKLKLLLVDDHAVVRLGLMTLLEDIPWVEIAGEAGTAAEAITAVAAHQPDVVLMDIRLPDDSGIVACGTITSAWPQIRVIMLTSYSDDALVMQAYQAGACCYILKQVGNQALIDALERMKEGELNLDPAATQENITRYHQELRVRGGDKFKSLTEREMRVLVEITDGKTNPQIASALAVSEQTVCNDINAIIDKLGVNNRFEAAIYAMRHKIKFHLPERAD
jgi:DNA-binding NarL/FixJ family response regulator